MDVIDPYSPKNLNQTNFKSINQTNIHIIVISACLNIFWSRWLWLIPIHNFKNKFNSQFTLRKLTSLDFYMFGEKKQGSGNGNAILKKKTSKKLCLSQQLVAWKGSWIAWKGSWIAWKEEKQGIMKQLKSTATWHCHNYWYQYFYFAVYKATLTQGPNGCPKSWPLPVSFSAVFTQAGHPMPRDTERLCYS